MEGNDRDAQTMQRYRTFTEERLKELLAASRSSMNLESVKQLIFEAKGSDFQSYLSDMLAALQCNNISGMKDSALQVIQDAWNYFPHRFLGGRSPVEHFGTLNGQDAVSAWVMNVDPDFERVDGAVLALLLLGLHARARVWKQHDWGVLRRLYERGYITDPARKAKSVVLTDSGLAEAQRLFEELFCESE
jgi:hypothetical protein